VTDGYSGRNAGAEALKKAIEQIRNCPRDSRRSRE
jgi:hypothetical protein